MSKFTKPVRHSEHGQRVKDAQWTLAGNNRFGQRFYEDAIDGVWGDASGRAADEARFALGFPDRFVKQASFGQQLFDYLRKDKFRKRLSVAYKVRRVARRGKHCYPPPAVHGAARNAQKLLVYHEQGKYRAENPGDMNDIRATARGERVWSRGGYLVAIDERVMEVLVYLIERGFRIGTFAICSDHHNDGPHGHAGGRAVDISSINGVSIGSSSSRDEVLAVLNALVHSPTFLRPRQLICGGYGSHRDASCSRYSVPAADSFYGSVTMGEHCNHIHWGV